MDQEKAKCAAAAQAAVEGDIPSAWYEIYDEFLESEKI
jgi:hypothetical protein